MKEKCAIGDGDLSPLTQRQLSELAYHNDRISRVDLDEVNVDRFFSEEAAIENRFILKTMGGVEALMGKRILDVGCGIGDASVFFAKANALVSGVDISDGAIARADSLAKRYGVSRERLGLFVGLAEKLPFEDSTFDFVYGNGILHHVDLAETLKEVKRVLKTDGKAFFVEPLKYNPLINIYRKVAAKNRTDGERPFGKRELEFFGSVFPNTRFEFFWLSSLLVFIFMYLRGKNPNEVQYWKEVIYNPTKISGIHRPLSHLDEVLIKLFPSLKWLCWTVVITAKK